MLFMGAFAEQAEAAMGTIIALADIKRRCVKSMAGNERPVAMRIMEMLFAHPHVTTRRVRGALGFSQTVAVGGISRLARAGILGRVPVRHRTRAWAAHGIIGPVRAGDPPHCEARGASP